MKPDKFYLSLEEEGYYNTIDKRSKDYREYKQWKATQVEQRLRITQEKRRGAIQRTRRHYCKDN